jgi:transposase
MTESDLAQQSQAELIALVVAQAAQVAELTRLVEQLQAENAALRSKLEPGPKPPTTSRNSSQPPSRDQKHNRPGPTEGGRRGPPKGHTKFERAWVAEPDQIAVVKPEHCHACQTALDSVAGQLVQAHQLLELPAAPARVLEVREYAVVCPGCGQVAHGVPPAGWERERQFGARLEATVVYYRQTQHLSYARTLAALRDLHGVTLSQGGIDQIMQRAGQAATQAVAALPAQIQQSAVVYSDETPCRVDGHTWWEWVFRSATAVLHQIRFDRSVDVIRAVLGAATVEVWVSDCYPAQLGAAARAHQLCLAHQLRNLQAVVDQTPAAVWPRAMQAVLRAGIHLHHQRAALSPPSWDQQRQRLDRVCNWLLKRRLVEPNALRLQHRYQKHRASLFVFLQRADVEPTNNVSERHLRPSVIHRKIIGCFRSEWGAHAYAALASVIGTAALTGQNAFQAILPLCGTPALPLPAPR